MSIVKSGGRAPNTKIFVDRADRIPLRIPVVFTSSDGKVRGTSVDISESGLLATFDQPLEVWISGQLSILVPEHPIFIETRIARVEGNTVAMSFRGMGARDLLIIQSLLKKAAQQPG